LNSFIKKHWKKIGIVLCILIFLVRFIPLPYYFIEGPGGAISLRSAVKVDGKKDKQKGDFYLTAVSMWHPTLPDLIKAKFFSEFEELVTQEEVMGSYDTTEYWQVQNYLLESSRNVAIYQASKLAGLTSKLTFEGVNVMSVDKRSKFYGKLEVGDIVTSIDGLTFRNTKEMIAYVQSKKAGQIVTVYFEHKKKKRQVKEKLVYLKENKSSGIGISLVDNTKVKTNVPIKIDLDKVGGPSGGMMFTLEIYQLLSGKNLRHGKKIAGTGTMEETGAVGRIGGIDKKVVSASQQGIEIFLAPNDEITQKMRKDDPKLASNYEEAKRTAEKINTKMKIVPVKTIQEAVTYLENLK
jgi:PDZ domain-containing protein